MLKVREPFWNRASLLCFDASVKKGSRTFAIPANGGHRPDHHHITQLRFRRKQKKDIFSRQKSHRCAPGGGAPSARAGCAWFRRNRSGNGFVRNIQQLSRSPTVTCGPLAPVLDRTPPSARLGRRGLRLVSSKSVGKWFST